MLQLINIALRLWQVNKFIWLNRAYVTHRWGLKWLSDIGLDRSGESTHCHTSHLWQLCGCGLRDVVTWVNLTKSTQQFTV